MFAKSALYMRKENRCEGGNAVFDAPNTVIARRERRAVGGGGLGTGRGGYERTFCKKWQARQKDITLMAACLTWLVFLRDQPSLPFRSIFRSPSLFSDVPLRNIYAERYMLHIRKQ